MKKIVFTLVLTILLLQGRCDYFFGSFVVPFTPVPSQGFPAQIIVGFSGSITVSWSNGQSQSYSSATPVELGFSTMITSDFPCDVQVNATKITKIDVHFNPRIIGLMVQNCPNLEELNYDATSFTGSLNVDVTQNPLLKKLSCSNNTMSSLNLSNNPLLQYLN